MAVFVAPAVVGLVWKFPVIMVGVVPHTVVGALLTTFAFVALFTMGLGLLLVIGIGAGVGYLLRNKSPWTAPLVLLSIALSIAACIPWLASRPVHYDSSRIVVRVMTGTLRTPIVGAAVTVNGETAITDEGGWARFKWPVTTDDYGYDVHGPCGTKHVDVRANETTVVEIRCP